MRKGEGAEVASFPNTFLRCFGSFVIPSFVAGEKLLILFFRVYTLRFMYPPKP